MKIGVSSGDLNGIGLECFAKSMAIFDNYDVNFKLYVNKENLAQYLGKCKNLPEYNFSNDILTINNHNIEIENIGEASEIEFGVIDKFAGNNAYQAIIKCTQDCIDKKTDAMLTLPISKESCYLAGMRFPGHTELIANLCGIKNPLMILYYKKFRTALQTVHIPIRSVPDRIKKDNIIEKVKQFAHSISFDFNEIPKIAVLGLNPHAGENGNIGYEEKDEIIPAIKELNRQGILVEGPFPADGFFAQSMQNNYTGVLAMYHDQGLIALKQASNGNGVNFTAGLPIIRTSPDHGTGFNIAGLGIANEQSTLETIIGAKEIYEARKRYEKSSY